MTWLKIVIQTLTHLIGKKADKRDVEQLRRDTIPVPAIASPGQTIVVKSVDENGKPTAWEAADIGDLIVAIRNLGTDSASCDKTSIEIAEAAKKGIPVIGHIIELDDSGVEQMRIANFAGLWDNGTPETIGAFFYDMKLASGYNAWGSSLSVRVLTVTPEGAVSYTGGSSFAAQTE